MNVEDSPRRDELGKCKIKNVEDSLRRVRCKMGRGAETLRRGICYLIMLKTFEEIRTEVLELDSESQRRLRDDIDRNLESKRTGYPEAKRRSEAVSRGEMKTVDGPDALARVKKLISR